eukprot:CAMPEP_0113953054 /NCGR_PEP_ID=MMETSP1339-20121228/90770_1 /TAXON_ID=94617 /ORGANISM="Fibrocapsa japonica" /LENGTH=178 /DNA_ID=CAMNT_0000961755 /DNA_START=717 /DNA_END=1253 /DNA_ORIENTATION=- /assembly_acc=CAM_ASM_000762
MDVHMLNLKTLEWQEVKCTGMPPEARVAHTCQYDPLSNTIYVWGGFNGRLVRLKDFYALDLGTMKWDSIHCSTGCPSARAFHASCLCEGSLYIFGGADGHKRHADVWKYQFHLRIPSLMVLAAQSVVNKVSDVRDTYGDILPDEVVDGIEKINIGADGFGRCQMSPKQENSSCSAFFS